MLSKTWTVIGAGPCGIASVGRLVDLGYFVQWIDPIFACGRMGKKYRNVPANTTNGDLVTALRMCESFEFRNFEKECHAHKTSAISDLNPADCTSLGVFTDALESATNSLKKRVRLIPGIVSKLKKESWNNPWQIVMSLNDSPDPAVFESDAIIYVGGAIPIRLNTFDTTNNNIIIHDMDSMVDPVCVRNLMKSAQSSDKVWSVFGRSHSAMLIIKNLIENDCKSIINYYKSSTIRYMHQTEGGWLKYQGIGLKGPVGDWAKSNYNSNPHIKPIQFDDNRTPMYQMMDHRVTDCVFAVGMELDLQTLPKTYTPTNPTTPIDIQAYLDYDRMTGEIKEPFHTTDDSKCLGLFGGGVAFPQDLINEDGSREPWVGFKRSIEQVDLMVERVQNSKII